MNQLIQIKEHFLFNCLSEKTFSEEHAAGNRKGVGKFGNIPKRNCLIVLFPIVKSI